MAASFHELFARAKAGDRAAIDALLGHHLEQLRAFVRVQSGDVVRRKESCSDLVQTVCRQMLEDLTDVEFEDESAFRFWLFRIARNKILNRVRHWQTLKRDVGREASVAGSENGMPLDGVLAAYGAICTPSQDVAVREEVRRIEEALDALPADQREVLILAKIVGRAYGDIAEDLGKSEVAVRKLVSRARARLGILLHRS